ncbi:MAG: sugar-binding domain-containing protein [Planctomycetota bacterium]|nr:sugar-binding domain-containing protein [Planctomycetota bacterium]
MNRLLPILLLLCCLVPATVDAEDWQAGQGRLMTRWAADVSPENAHREYPRPQLVRDKWLNLNGLWQYAIRPTSETGMPSSFDGEILVPFPAESALSGVMREVGPENRLWYRRSFSIPADWAGERVVLHFGAVDWQATVWVNGRKVGEHRGGYDPFSFDITSALSDSGPQQITLSVWDPTDAGTQARGKQIRKPESIWYSPVTGIWQTVWLEPVPETSIERVKIVPDAKNGKVQMTVSASGDGQSDAKIRIVSRSLGDAREAIDVIERSGKAGTPMAIEIPEPRLWTPDTPWLYQYEVQLDGGDKATGYFGLRDVALGRDGGGNLRLLLNGEPLFHYGPLDQGWWPDGLYTAPSDEALLYDLLVTKEMGFNMVRKHVKVEPARWYAHCDRLGLLVWQDMPNGDLHIRPEEPDIDRSAQSRHQYEAEWSAIIDAFHNYPCIVMWVPFNEGWGQFDTQRIVDWTRKLDPTRLIDNASGWSDRDCGDVLDIHAYPGPAMPPLEKTRAVVLGEYGGLGLPVEGHTWTNKDNWGYRGYTSEAELNDAYHDLVQKLRPLIDSGLAAAVYTQTTDVETEVNGLLTYDRVVNKFDVPRAAEAHARLYEPPNRLLTVMPTSTKGALQPWRYTKSRPAEDWFAADFNDSQWNAGKGGFGSASSPAAIVGTEWTEPDIWLRRTLQINGEPPTEGYWRIHHDEDAEVYVNGKLVQTFPGYTQSATLVPLSPDTVAALKRGKNVIAVHCRQTDGGQYIDLGILEAAEQ